MANDEDHSDRARGIREIARSIVDHGSDYAEARLELAKLEAGEAGDLLRGVSIRLGIGIFTATAGYTACLVGSIALIGHHYFESRWEIPALIAGGIHLFVAALFLLGARRQANLAGNLFSSTRRELSKDQLWLKQKSNPAPREDAPN